MTKHDVIEENDLEEGERVLVDIKGREVAVFNIDDEYYAYLNWCPHQGGPVCEGLVDGTMSAAFDRDSLETEFHWEDDEQVLSCAWHGWEFDLMSGECISRRESEENANLLSYPVEVEDGKIVITM